MPGPPEGRRNEHVGEAVEGQRSEGEVAPVLPTRADQRAPWPRGAVALAWATGPAAAYVLLSLVHARADGILSVEVGFSRSLAFWVGAIYLSLLLWGFLPRRPVGWYARRQAVLPALLVGAFGALVCGGLAVAWLARHGNVTVALPVLASIATLGLLAAYTLHLAGRAEGDS